jgi:adenylate cyclase
MFAIRLLGSTELEDADGRVHLRGKKQLALLGYLSATAPARHARDKLAALLWGDTSDDKARQSLRQALVTLRAVLPADAVISNDETLSINIERIQCDVIDFERLANEGSARSLARAAALYRGSLLADLSVDAAEWAEWLAVERQRFQDIAVDVLVRHAEYELKAGRSVEALAIARRAISLDGFREDAHRAAIASAAASGRRAQAMRLYDELRAFLARELDVEPDDDTKILLADIQRAGGRDAGVLPGDPTPDRQPNLRAPTMALDPAQTILAVDSGRDRTQDVVTDIAAVQSAIRVASGGRGRLVDRRGDIFLFHFADGVEAVNVGQALSGSGRRMAVHMSSDRQEAKSEAADLAARLEPGQIVVTGDVCDTIVDGIDATIFDLGERAITSDGRLTRLYRIGPACETRRPPRATRILPAVAVLPFQGEARDRTARLAGRFLADEINAALSASQELSVISRLSTARFAGSPLAVGEICGRLDADFALYGSCTQAGSQMLLDVELADMRSHRTLWRKSFNALGTTLAAARPELVDEVLSLTRGAILAHELERSQTEPLETLENYALLAAAISLLHRTSPSSLERGGEILYELVSRLPHHPLPLAWRAQMHLFRITLGLSSGPAEEQNVTLEDAAKALDLNPTCSIALATEAWVNLHLRKRFDIASDRLELALQSNPSDATAWLLKGTMHAFRGDGALAVQATERALQLSPLDPRKSYFDSLAAAAYLANGEPERAIAHATQSLRVNRQHASTVRALIVAYVVAGRVQEARALMPDLLALHPGLTVSSYLTHHPAAEFETGRIWANALRAAGLPP